MLLLVAMCFLTGIMILNVFSKQMKLSNVIILAFPIGVSFHTFIFILLSLFNVYYNKWLFILISILSFLFLAIKKDEKIKIINDLRGIPVYYVLFFAYVIVKLFLLVTSGLYDFYNWDELGTYDRVSMEIYLFHDFDSMYAIYTPMSYFLGSMTYEFTGLSIISARIISIIYYTGIVLFIYVALKNHRVNRHIAALISMIFLVSSSELLVLAKTFYTNIPSSLYIITGLYILLQHYFIENKKGISYIGLIMLLSSMFLRREMLLFIICILAFLGFILLIQKKINIRHFFFLMFPAVFIKVMFGIAAKFLYSVPDSLSSSISSVVNLTDLGKKMQMSSIFSFLQGVFDQTLNSHYYYYNFMIYIVFILSIVATVIFLIIKNNKAKKGMLSLSVITILIEFAYIALIIGVEFLVFNIDEFKIAASFSRYLIAFMPLNFIILGCLLFADNDNEIKDRKRIQSNTSRDSKILLIIPAYNEEDNILKVYQSVIKYNKKSRSEYDVIVINDGSKDKTGDICIENGIPVINLIHNLGIGGAVQTGYKYAYENNYDIAVQFDGDGQHDVQYVKKIVQPILDGQADFTIGSRFIESDNDNFQSTLSRRIGINMISLLIKWITKCKVYDTTSGFRACNKQIIADFAKLYPTEYPEPVSTVELLKKGYRVNEIAVKMNERLGGTSSIHSWRTAYYMVNVMLSIFIVGLRSDR